MSLRTELLSAPIKEWDKKSQYDAIFLVPTRKKHDSGWMLIAVVGEKLIVTDNNTCRIDYEIAAYCDNVCWKVPNIEESVYWNLHTDCDYPSGLMHFHLDGYKFEVGPSFSSTEITLVPES